MKALVSFASVVLASFFALNVNAQNKLTVKVDNLEDSKGVLKVALFNSEKTFLSPVAQGQSVAIDGTSAEVVFENLPSGKYGIALYQDCNNNGQLDLGEMGIPVEKYGFSNDIDPAVIMGPPTFAACKFEVSADKIVVINAVSAIKK